MSHKARIKQQKHTSAEVVAITDTCYNRNCNFFNQNCNGIMLRDFSITLYFFNSSRGFCPPYWAQRM
jgi:hypothetical protein